jgi:threonine dehydratase
LEEAAPLDAIIAPVGGGGLVAGTCLAAEGICEVYGAEPFEADDAWRSLQSGNIESNDTTNTIADGLKTQLGDINFPIIQSHINSIIRVTEQEIIDAMRLIWTRLKIVAEPSSAVTLAALLCEKALFEGKRVGLIISGGNVDVGNLPF